MQVLAHVWLAAGVLCRDVNDSRCQPEAAENNVEDAATVASGTQQGGEGHDAEQAQPCGEGSRFFSSSETAPASYSVFRAGTAPNGLSL